jgi:Chalcone isomerase-like
VPGQTRAARFVATTPGGRRLAIGLLALTLGLAMPAAVLATSPRAPSSVASAISSPRLSGAGRFTWFGLKIYEARLWIGPDRFDPSQFAASAFALELQYARSLDGKAIADSSADEIEQLGLGNESARQRWREAMSRIFPNVAENDRLIGIHKPGAGVSFVLNDRPIGAIDDPQFGAAFFAIWLDPKTRAPGLRKAILAGAAQQANP